MGNLNQFEIQLFLSESWYFIAPDLYMLHLLDMNYFLQCMWTHEKQVCWAGIIKFASYKQG